jgi:hypothetical protein
MKNFDKLLNKITEKHGDVVDFKKNPKILEDILQEFKAINDDAWNEYNKMAIVAPFGISWMDSWLAQWTLNQNASFEKGKEFPAVLNELVDLKFTERLGELEEFILRYRLAMDEPPDGGTPEPGVPNPPDPPDPPDPGPDSQILRDNPWIFYWFVSVNAPLILDMIDAHFTKRLSDLKAESSKEE